MVQEIYTTVSNRKIARDVYEMVLSGDTSALTAPGQFINIKIEGCFLRRPISVCDWDGDTVKIVYKVVGSGTAAMSEMAAGQTLDVLAGLGNGFDTAKSGEAPLLVGGGVGTPPMVGALQTAGGGRKASHGRARLCFAGGCLLRGQVPLSWRGCPYRNGGRQLRRAWLCNRRDGGHGRFVFLCLRADPDAARRLGCIALGRTAQLRGAHGAAASAPVWAAPAKRNMGTRESAGTVRC